MARVGPFILRQSHRWDSEGETRVQSAQRSLWTRLQPPILKQTRWGNLWGEYARVRTGRITQ